MNNKIAKRLGIYFLTTLLTFSLSISLFYYIMSKSYTKELTKGEMIERASKISTTFSTILSGKGTGMNGHGEMKGFGAYLKFIDDIAMMDVWIVDQNLNIISNQHMKYNIEDLPENAEEVVKEVFKGNTQFSEKFSSYLDTPTMTVGVPIKVNNNLVIGAVLLHSPISGMADTIKNSQLILIFSLAIGLIISIILIIWLTVKFTRPLNELNNMALVLAKGEFGIEISLDQDDEIGTLGESLNLLSAKLKEGKNEREELDKLKKNFIANVSHELRTPVTVVRGYLEGLMEGIFEKPEEIKENYERMFMETQGMERLVNDLLELSRLENKEFNIEKHHINLIDILNDVIYSGKKLGKKKNIVFNYTQKNSKIIINGDYGRLRQMFMTVIDNAIKFSPYGGEISISQNTTVNNQGILVCIKDQGNGINKEELEHIFDQFYKTKEKENHTGTGLGLPIAKEIANRHDILIEVNSALNEGTEFNFIIKNIID